MTYAHWEKGLRTVLQRAVHPERPMPLSSPLSCRDRVRALEALRALDNHTLADLGIERSELAAVPELGGNLPRRAGT